MQRKFLTMLVIVLASGMVRAQSLGDAARANRDKESASPKPAVVVTTDDLQSDSAPPADSVSPARPGKARLKPVSHSGEQPIDPAKAEAWKQRILEQKDRIQTLQQRIDQLNNEIHPPGAAEFNGPPSRDRAKMMRELDQVQLQCDTQKRKLASMQDQARRAGMHTTVYDP